MTDRAGKERDAAGALDLRSAVEASALVGDGPDLGFVLSTLLLVAMGRLVATRGVVVLREEGGGEGGAPFRVAATKGASGLRLGASVSLDEAPREDGPGGDALPEALRAVGFALALPLRRGAALVGLVGIGPKATGAAFSADEVAFARSLVNLSAPAVHAAQSADALRVANGALAQRVQELNTLFELAQAFGAAPGRERTLRQLRNALLGQFPVRRALVLLPSPDGPLEVALAYGFPALSANALARFATFDAPTFALETVAVKTAPRRGAPAQRVGSVGTESPSGPSGHLPEGEGSTSSDGVLAALGLTFAVPLRSQGATRGVLALGPRATGRAYTPADAEFVTSLGLLALAALENAALVEARIAGERLEAEVRLARGVQERLMPTVLPQLPGLDTAALALASREVAGDTFDLVALDENRLLLAVADVAGKGMPAALLMANLQACLRVAAPALDPDAPDLAAATLRVNRVVCASTEATAFITLVWGVLDRRTGRLVYVNAGHPAPVLVRADGTVERLEAGGLLLGVLPDAPYAQGEAVLAPGDMVALFTDGISEARDPADTDDYGEDRVADCLATHRAESAAAALAALRDNLLSFTADAPLADDLTLVVVKRAD